VGAKILPFVFLGELWAGRAKSPNSKTTAGIKRRFLKDELDNAMLAAQRPPRAAFRPPQRPLQASPAYGASAAKTTTANTTKCQQ